MPRNYLSESKINIDFKFLLDSDGNKQTYLSIVENSLLDISKSIHKSLPSGYRLVQFNDSDGFKIALLSDNTESVLYYIDCIIIDDLYLNAKPVTQVLLWRTNNTDYYNLTSGLAELIFRNLLLDKYNIVASDSNQTLQGRGFWERQLDYSLSYGEYVYRYDRINCELLPITDRQSIRDNSVDLWGDSEEYENILAIISKDILKV